MSALKKIAIAGSTGNLGPAILKRVVEAGFDVTVLTRQQGAHSLPASVKVAEVDYDSLDSLTNALTGQDALVSTISTPAVKKQLLLVEAAVKAGVKRFIPSEFGSDTFNPKANQLPVYTNKIAVQNALKTEAATSGLTYTFILNGPFFDWGLRAGFLAKIKERSVTLWDGGEQLFSTTTLDSIGQAVVGVLKNPEETKNRPVYVQDVAISLKQILEIGKKVTGSDDWKAIPADLNEFVNKGWEELKKPQPDPHKFGIPLLAAAIWGEGYGGKFEKLDNELLGVKGLDEGGVEALVKQIAT
ncbi:NAD(P)-binding protein, partial [Xylaria venustula]